MHAPAPRSPALGRLDPDIARQRIAAIGLRYSLVTAQTSLVAVDDTPISLF